MGIKIVAIILGIIIAVCETIGAIGSGMVWKNITATRLWGFFLIIIGFGGSIGVYILMRKFIVNLGVAQAIFIGGTAVFAAIFTIYQTKTIRWEIIVGLILIAIGAIFINHLMTD